jgi:uncharacterized Rmd1/YagE family protein
MLLIPNNHQALLSVILPALILHQRNRMSSYYSADGLFTEDMPLLPAGVGGASGVGADVGGRAAGGAKNQHHHPHNQHVGRHRHRPSLEAVLGGPADTAGPPITSLESRQQQQQQGSSSQPVRSKSPLPGVDLGRIPSPMANRQGRQLSAAAPGYVPGGFGTVPGLMPNQAKRVSKPSRPRKAISEFRKKTRTLPLGWRGRIGVHVHVDEINIEKLGSKIKSKFLARKLEPGKELLWDYSGGDGGGWDGGGGGSDWDVIEYYDAIRVWQTAPPFLGQDLVQDWPLSEDEDAGMEGKDAVAEELRQPSIDFEAARPEVYLFSFGAAVFWNFPSEDVEIQWLKDHVLEPFKDAVGDDHTNEEVEAAKDEMAFVYSADKKFSLRRDVAHLESRETGEKLAVSFALAKSSLLSVYEERVQKTIDRNSHIPEEMVKNGRLHMTRQDISREVGRMLLVKHGINLDSVRPLCAGVWDDLLRKLGLHGLILSGAPLLRV